MGLAVPKHRETRLPPCSPSVHKLSFCWAATVWETQLREYKTMKIEGEMTQLGQPRKGREEDHGGCLEQLGANEAEIKE